MQHTLGMAPVFTCLEDCLVQCIPHDWKGQSERCRWKQRTIKVNFAVRIVLHHHIECRQSGNACPNLTEHAHVVCWLCSLAAW